MSLIARVTKCYPDRHGLVCSALCVAKYFPGRCRLVCVALRERAPILSFFLSVLFFQPADRKKMRLKVITLAHFLFPPPVDG